VIESNEVIAMIWDDVRDFLVRGGAMIIPGVFLLLFVAAKTLLASKTKVKKSNAGSMTEVIAGRKEQRVIVVYSRSNLSPSDWKEFGLTIIDLKESERGSKVGTEDSKPNPKDSDEAADASLVERLEMSESTSNDEGEELTADDEAELQDLIDFVEEQQALGMEQEDVEEPLDISALSKDQGL
jgi:hypothetical protein